MITCSFCKFQNMEGMLYCEDCGTPLLGEDVVHLKGDSTHQLPKNDSNPLFASIPVGGGTTMLKATTVLVLTIEQQRVVLEHLAETFLGRTDELTQNYPDIDLTPYEAVEKGVSRQHASIRRDEDSVMLVDLGSANGTFLNGKQIMPQQPHVLRDGDEIRFGKLITRIFFT